MGYDVTVKFKTSEERELMKSFLDKNQELLNAMKDLPHLLMPYHDNVVAYGEELGYAPNYKNLLGFHGTGIPLYIWKLCAWMAVKSTFRKNDGSIYFFYDNEKMVVTFDKNNTQNTVVDEKGIFIQYETGGFLGKINNFFSKVDKDTKILFEKLNDNWEQFLVENKNEKAEVKNNKSKLVK